MKLMEKKDRLEELGIVNITSDKMVEDMTIKDEFSTPLIITIITLAGSLLLVAAIYGCHQRLSQKKDQNIHPDVPGFDDGHVALIFNVSSNTGIGGAGAASVTPPALTSGAW